MLPPSTPLHPSALTIHAPHRGERHARLEPAQHKVEDKPHDADVAVEDAKGAAYLVHVVVPPSRGGACVGRKQGCGDGCAADRLECIGANCQITFEGTN